MKKILLIICSLAIFLTACSNTVSTNEEMLKVIKEKENLSADIKECGTVIDDGILLIIGVTGENEQTYNYYAGQFSIEQDDKYKFEKVVSLNDIGWQFRECKWQNGYVLLCNNDDVVEMQIVIKEIESEEVIRTIEIEDMPWVYYLNVSDIQLDFEIQYIFLDSDGKEV